MTQCYIGTSGYHYKDWKGLFYPESLSTSDWLQYYAGIFNTVEINSSFYRMPNEKTILYWNQCTRKDFVFSVKASRYITHIKRLSGSADAFKNFVSSLFHLGGKLAVILYQLPPNMKRNDYILESFLSNLSPQYGHVFEFRHKSWISEEIFKLLDSYHAGFCIYNLLDYTTPLIQTSDFVYIRLHGSQSLYSSCYSNAELHQWAREITAHAKKARAVYVYFNNDTSAYAVRNAFKLRSLLLSGLNSQLTPDINKR